MRDKKTMQAILASFQNYLDAIVISDSVIIMLVYVPYSLDWILNPALLLTSPGFMSGLDFVTTAELN